MGGQLLASFLLASVDSSVVATAAADEFILYFGSMRDGDKGTAVVLVGRLPISSALYRDDCLRCWAVATDIVARQWRR